MASNNISANNSGPGSGVVSRPRTSGMVMRGSANATANNNGGQYGITNI